MKRTSAAIRLFLVIALALWALVDAYLSARQSSTFWFGVYLFIQSLLLSTLFIGAIVLVWEFVARKVLRRH